VKRYRRIEITAFRQRVMIVSGDPVAETGDGDVSVNDDDSRDVIEIASEEGQERLIEAARLLEEKISETARREAGQAN
jgi:hypothetical protein